MTTKPTKRALALCFSSWRTFVCACCVFVAALCAAFVPFNAYAQRFSAGGLAKQAEETSISACRGEAIELSQRLITVRQIINSIVTCNQNGQVYNSATNTCITPLLSPDHRFVASDTGASIALENTDGSFGAGIVVGGAKGATAQCEPIPANNCTAPWGGAIADGSSVTAYQTSSVAYGSTCSSQTRTCADGILSGSYSYQNCTVGDPGSCRLPWGGTINHGSSVTAYQAATVAYGNTCSSQTRSCNNGSLSGSYGYQSCTVADPATCALPWGGTINNGQSVTAYQAATVAYGSTCSSQTRSCSNGALSGSYAYEGCTVNPPARCNLPWGGTIAHNSSITAYKDASVPSTGSCTGETRSCNNGALSGSYANKNCTKRDPVTTCSPWQWDFDGWCRTGAGGREIKQCNNFNLFQKACNGDPTCTLKNFKYIVNTCAVCNVEADRCYTR